MTEYEEWSIQIQAAAIQMRRFGRMLAAWRQASPESRSLRKVAARLRCDHVTLHRIEKGLEIPTERLLQQLLPLLWPEDGQTEP